MNEDLTMAPNDSNDVGWWDLDLDPQFPQFNNSDLVFDTTGTVFGLQNEQSTSISANLHFSPTFNSQNISLDMSQAPNSYFEQFSGPSSHNNFSVPSVAVTPAVINASQPNQFIASSFMQFLPTPPLAPAFPHTDALLPTIAPALVNALPSNASSPTVIPDNASPQPTATATSVSLSQPADASFPAPDDASFPAPDDASFPPPDDASLPPPDDASLPPPAQITVSQHGSVALSPSSDSRHAQLAGNPETSALSSAVCDTSSDSSNQGDGRRSGRNPVPSKRHEQMNEIDGKSKKTTASAHIQVEKENIPSTTPEWAIASQDHLLNSDLGKDWTACVEAWCELEKELGYGSQPGTKVCLLISLQVMTLDLILYDREHYRSQQLVHRSGQHGHLSPVLVSATTSVHL